LFLEDKAPVKKENLPVPPAAVAVNKEIVVLLEQLVSLRIASPCSPEFVAVYEKILTLFSLYQQRIIDDYGRRPTCAKGCSLCCNHWVEDVYSFEAEIIAAYIRKQFPEKVEAIIRRCAGNEKEIARLDDIVQQKLAEHSANKEVADIDPADLVLASYYQLQRPCALVSQDGVCAIYPVRPLTCRIYTSFSDVTRCRAEYINEKDIPTYLLDLQEDASKLLDTLHETYNRYNKSGLQAVLIDYLS